LKKSSLLLFGLVPIFNILLNINIQKTAKNSSSFTDAILSGSFATSFVIGMFSITSLLALYLTGVNLARGILMMGAFSIVGGSLYGVLLQNNTLSNLEWIMLALIFFIFSYRLYIA